jgi:hypothetical protein
MSQHIKTRHERQLEQWPNHEGTTLAAWARLKLADEEIRELRAALAQRTDSGKVAEAYGILWHVNAGMDAPAGLGVISVAPEKAAYEARKALRDMLTKEQRGQGIEAARQHLASLPILPRTGMRDWSEDHAHENGWYQCKCATCEQMFYGHKRRVMCKVCSRAPAADSAATEQADVAQKRARREGEPEPPAGPQVPACKYCTGCREWGGNGLWHHAGCPTKQGACWLEQPASGSQPAERAAEPVGKVVANHPVHGWHMEALKPWNEIGDGTLLFAAAPSSADVGELPHSDDIWWDKFAAECKAKMQYSREVKGRGGWDDKDQCTVQYLAELFVDHIEKGDPIDLANFCMMLWARGQMGYQLVSFDIITAFLAYHGIQASSAVPAKVGELPPVDISELNSLAEKLNDKWGEVLAIDAGELMALGNAIAALSASAEKGEAK